jgi:hypothetical protein
MNNTEQLNLLKTFALISAILNIIFALTWIVYTVALGAITCGIMCVFGFIPVINIIACIMDFITYSKLNNQNQTGTFGTIQFTAIFDIITVLTGNIASMIFGIIALIFLNNTEVKNYLTEKGIY